MSCYHSHKSCLRYILLIAMSLIMSLIALTYFIKPAQQSFSPHSIEISKHHNEKETVSTAGMMIFSFVSSIVFALAYIISSQDKVTAFWGCLLAFIFGFGFDQAVTLLLKVSVGRLRPDFLERCKMNVTAYHEMRAQQIAEFGVETSGYYPCTGDEKAVNEGHMSFPSGHSSTSGFAAWFCVTLCFSRALKITQFLKNEKHQRNRQKLSQVTEIIPSNQDVSTSLFHLQDANEKGQHEQRRVIDASVASDIEANSSVAIEVSNECSLNCNSTKDTNNDINQSTECFSSSSGSSAPRDRLDIRLITPSVVYVTAVVLSLIPLVLSMWIAATRVSDHWHHPSDCVFGWLIGVVSGLSCFPVLWLYESERKEEKML
ncbi:putative diacylglycerol diphosphate phosphatase / phosphatidate phosphatase [Monocercomonoides exilis]|uniref:putative diacylglycerol diphosphate phosphatase / phosphatidate phosphatase n=1 Tax=Monocercomonoides exilis TaxID=2049356 RepID=UPI00355A6FF6|nr:putative diacylglycerol diphosphate phosphatase / phosphatidate phosphatase [Monocercomonoides exilis]